MPVWQNPRFTGKPLTAKLAGGTITTQLTATLDRGVQVQLADLGVKALPLDKVLVDFLCQGYAITGPLDLTGAADLRDARHRQHAVRPGPAPRRQRQGRRSARRWLWWAAWSEWAARSPRSLAADPAAATLGGSPLEFDSIVGTYTMTNGVVTTRDLLYTSRVMKVAVAGEYGLGTGAMNLDMVVNHKQGELKAKVTGTAAAPPGPRVDVVHLKSVDPDKAEKGIRDLLKRFNKK